MNNTSQNAVAWTTPTLIATYASVAALASVVIGMIWGYAGVTFSVQAIPKLQSQQVDNTRDIAILKVRDSNRDSQYTEILRQFYVLSDKIDRLNDQKADKESRR